MNILKPEIDESKPPRFLSGIDSILRMINLGPNWHKYFIFRISLPLWIIGTIEYAIVHSNQAGYDAMLGIFGSFFWCFVLSYWYITRRFMAYWDVFFSFAILYFTILIIMKIF